MGRDEFRRRPVRPKRSLGQHFLVNTAIVEKMLSLADLKADPVLEVGPGRGILTRRLVQKASRVLAVEKDDILCEELAAAFKGQINLELIHSDILDLDLDEHLVDGMKIIANLPYNIATQFIIRILEQASRLSAVVVMVQSEVALRICASPGDPAYSAMSVLVSSAFVTHAGFVVMPANFFPRPKVDSRVIKLIPRTDPVTRSEVKAFKAVVFTAFGQRRKILRNSLIRLPGLNHDHLSLLAHDAGIDLGVRPQELSQETYRRFARLYQERIVCAGPNSGSR